MMKELRKVVIPIGPSVAYVELTQDQWACINSEDANRIGRHNWHAWWNDNTQSFYARRNSPRGDGKRKILTMQSDVIGVHPRKIPDHKNGATLDNRQQNLRQASYSENQYNKKLTKANSSGVSGVCYHQREKLWIATIKVKGKSKYLGGFKEKDKAIAARHNGEKRYHGEFRRVA